MTLMLHYCCGKHNNNNPPVVNCIRTCISLIQTQLCVTHILASLTSSPSHQPAGRSEPADRPTDRLAWLDAPGRGAQRRRVVGGRQPGHMQSGRPRMSKRGQTSHANNKPTRYAPIESTTSAEAPPVSPACPASDTTSPALKVPTRSVYC